MLACAAIATPDGSTECQQGRGHGETLKRRGRNFNVG